jgi:hypothetical protein
LLSGLSVCLVWVEWVGGFSARYYRHIAKLRADGILHRPQHAGSRRQAHQAAAGRQAHQAAAGRHTRQAGTPGSRRGERSGASA